MSYETTVNAYVPFYDERLDFWRYRRKHNNWIKGSVTVSSAPQDPVSTRILWGTLHCSPFPWAAYFTGRAGQAHQSGLHLSKLIKLRFNVYTVKICFPMCSSIEFDKYSFVSTARMIMHAKLASFLSAHSADHFSIPVCSRSLSPHIIVTFARGYRFSPAKDNLWIWPLLL